MKIFRQTKFTYDENNNPIAISGAGVIKTSIQHTDISFADCVTTLVEYAKDAHSSNWYVDANVWAQSVAKLYNLSLKVVCDVTALLSPLTEWNLNKRRAERVFEAWQRGERISVSFKTTMSNVYNCLEGKPFKLGPKTSCFAQAIFEPNNHENLPVIDSLAMQIVLGLGDIPASLGFKEKSLELVQQVYVEAARLYNVTPVSLQAATWVKANVRRKMNRNVIPTILGDNQSIWISVADFHLAVKALNG